MMYHLISIHKEWFFDWLYCHYGCLISFCLENFQNIWALYLPHHGKWIIHLSFMCSRPEVLISQYERKCGISVHDYLWCYLPQWIFIHVCNYQYGTDCMLHFHFNILSILLYIWYHLFSPVPKKYFHLKIMKWFSDIV